MTRMSRNLRTCALLLAIAVPLALAGCGDSKTDDTASSTTAGPELSTAFGSMDKLPGILKTPPPWPANEGQLQLRLRAIGLPALQAEGQVIHIHQHLDVFVGGKAVEIPANIGIGPGSTFISPLHTHTDPASIIHVESPTESRFSLGQFFAVWGVRLSADCIGGDCAGAGGKQLRTWVDGKPVAGDPTRIVLQEHEEIVLAYGTAAQMPKQVPSTYDFESAGV
ncbi:MAG: hypothetical protein QOI73_2313 [Solirubrobacteraceae bacterium]|nr:hypothetical protein [Solirubrobacteraceae bacterium]